MDYTLEDVAKMIDHSLLNPTLRADDLERGCRPAVEYGVSSAFIMPYYLRRCAEILRGGGVKAGTTLASPRAGTPRPSGSPRRGRPWPSAARLGRRLERQDRSAEMLVVWEKERNMRKVRILWTPALGAERQKLRHASRHPNFGGPREGHSR